MKEVLTNIGNDGEQVGDDIINEHTEFRRRIIVGDRPYDEIDNDDSIWVKVNWYEDCDNNSLTSTYVDNKNMCRLYHNTHRTINEVTGKEEFVHIIDGTNFNDWWYQITSLQREWYRRISKIHRDNRDFEDVTMEEFFRIINQPDFDIEGYLISKQICYDTEKDVLNTKTRKQLGEKFEELMGEK